MFQEKSCFRNFSKGWRTIQRKAECGPTFLLSSSSSSIHNNFCAFGKTFSFTSRVRNVWNNGGELSSKDNNPSGTLLFGYAHCFCEVNSLFKSSIQENQSFCTKASLFLYLFICCCFDLKLRMFCFKSYQFVFFSKYHPSDWRFLAFFGSLYVLTNQIPIRQSKQNKSRLKTKTFKIPKNQGNKSRS